jgi:hypothetical protein
VGGVATLADALSLARCTSRSDPAGLGRVEFAHVRA